MMSVKPPSKMSEHNAIIDFFKWAWAPLAALVAALAGFFTWLARVNRQINQIDVVKKELGQKASTSMVEKRISSVENSLEKMGTDITEEIRSLRALFIDSLRKL